MDGWMGRLIDGCIDEQKDGRWMEEWMNRKRQKDGWMNGWMGRFD